MSKLVSVIIPTHNYAHFVGRAIDSALAQTYDAVEVIVVDDGSTDDTPRLLANYGERIRVIRKEKQGPGIARNAGIRAAHGEYVAFLDSDDAWRPHKIARQVEALEARPELGLVGVHTEMVDGSGAPITQVRFPSPPESADRTYVLRAIAERRLWVGGSCSGALVRRHVLDEVGLFDESLTAAEDWDLWLRIAARYPIWNVPEVLTLITLHGTGFARNAEKVERNQWKVFAAAVKGWPHAFDRGLRRRVRALILADAGAEYVGGRDYRTALQRYAASLLAWPLNGSRWRVTARLVLKQVGI